MTADLPPAIPRSVLRAAFAHVSSHDDHPGTPTLFHLLAVLQEELGIQGGTRPTEAS